MGVRRNPEREHDTTMDGMNTHLTRDGVHIRFALNQLADDVDRAHACSQV